MKFTKPELLKIFVAMSNAVDYSHFLDRDVTPEFESLMIKIRDEILKK